MIRAFVVTLVTFAYVLVAGPPLLLYALLTGNGEPVYRVGVGGVKMALWLAGVRVDVRGLEKIPHGCAVVYMANHQGNCDPPALLAILPRVMVMAKKEFFRIPILGRAMLACRFIPVDRKNREQAVRAVERAVGALRAGDSFLVCPEGTRSPDGRLQPFKKGVFVMALKAGAPILPISISGSNKIMAKRKFVIRPGVVRVTAHDAVLVGGLEGRGEVMERVRQAILSGLTKEEWPLERGRELPATAVRADTAKSA
jgi:1-acyl-sn-glycerol-3-phosphate acyltransferase